MTSAPPSPITLRQEMPAPLLALFGELGHRQPEPDHLYEGDPDRVPALLQRIFPATDFRQLTPSRTFRELRTANRRLRSLLREELASGDGTARIVAETISMAYRTCHPLAANRVLTEISVALDGLRAAGHGDALSILDVGYGPGTLSMAVYALAEAHGFVPTLTGVDRSTVHRAMACYLYPPERWRVRWTVGDGTRLPSDLGHAFPLTTAFDVGHHLDRDEYAALVRELLRCTSGHVILSDPAPLRAARRIVGLITARDLVHDQAVASYAASWSARELRALYARVFDEIGDPGLGGTLLNTGFMHITHLWRGRVATVVSGARSCDAAAGCLHG